MAPLKGGVQRGGGVSSGLTKGRLGVLLEGWTASGGDNKQIMFIFGRKAFSFLRVLEVGILDSD